MKGRFLALLVALLTVAVWAPPADAAGGDIKWRFELRGQYVHRPPVVDAAGNIAVVASSGDVYSLTPEGTLRWTVQYLGGDGGPTVGADGTVYVASGDRVTAIAPDGSIRWQFTQPVAGKVSSRGRTSGRTGISTPSRTSAGSAPSRSLPGHAPLEQPG